MPQWIRIAIAAILVGMLTACQTAAIIMMNAVPMTSLQVQGDKLYVMDILNSKTFGDVKSIIADNPDVTTLVFTAMPGSIDDEKTFKMGRWIRQKGLNTHLTSESVIASGAVDLFLSGTERTMETGAQLGVHSWSDGSKEAAEFPKDSEEHDLNKTYITDMGVPEDFYWFTIYAAPADNVMWMTEEQVVKYGLLTKPVLSAVSLQAIPFKDFQALRTEILSTD